MSMKTQNLKKRNQKPPNLNKAILIQVALKTKGIKQRKIAIDLGITDAAVSRAIYGLSTNKRVDAWVEENLGIAV